MATAVAASSLSRGKCVNIALEKQDGGGFKEGKNATEV